jgi:hypothetical protein
MKSIHVIWITGESFVKSGKTLISFIRNDWIRKKEPIIQSVSILLSLAFQVLLFFRLKHCKGMVYFEFFVFSGQFDTYLVKIRPGRGWENLGFFFNFPLKCKRILCPKDPIFFQSPVVIIKNRKN